MVRHTELIKYVALVRSYKKMYNGFNITHIPWSGNEEADILAKAAVQATKINRPTFYEELSLPSIQLEIAKTRFVSSIASEDWCNKIMQSLLNPNNSASLENQRQEQRARNYTIIDGTLLEKMVQWLHC